MTLLTTAFLHLAVSNLAFGGGFRAYYGVPWGYYGAPFAPYGYYPWVGCMGWYGCRDPYQTRLDIERDRRMQELRELATPSERRTWPGDGPWGRQPYLPPPTPEANIQPAYRDASLLRPEYRQSTQPSAKPATEPLE